VNAEEFYEEIKAFLRYVGLDFYNKDKVAIHIENGKVRMSHGRTVIYIDVNGEEQ